MNIYIRQILFIISVFIRVFSGQQLVERIDTMTNHSNYRRVGADIEAR